MPRGFPTTRAALRGGHNDSMSCLEKRRLLVDFDTATSRFAQAVKDYRCARGTPAREQLELFEAVVDEARKACENAMRALQRHENRHGGCEAREFHAPHEAALQP
jgi:hypothetical protein